MLPSRIAAAAEPAAVTAPRSQVAALAAPKAAVVRAKASVVGASLPPLVIVQAPGDVAEPAARNDEVFFPKTIKDRVVAATQRAVAVIGGIPAWFGVIGDRIGGERARSPAARGSGQRILGRCPRPAIACLQQVTPFVFVRLARIFSAR